MVDGELMNEVLTGEFSPAEEPKRWQPKSHWDEHPVHTVEGWKYDVDEDNTRQSYVDWVNSRIELEDAD